MKWTIGLSLVAVLFLGIQSSLAQDVRAAPKQLQFDLRLLEGDPLGSKEAGTLKVLSEPSVRTLEGHCFGVASGIGVPPVSGEPIQLGFRIEGKFGTVKDGKIQLDLTLSHSTAGEKTKTQTQIHTISTRAIMSVPLGEVVKLRLGKGAADKQTWIELKVHE